MYADPFLNNQPHFPRLPNRAIGPDSFQLLIRVHDGAWTHSHRYHKPTLYQLSYAHSSERWESNPLLLGYEPSVIFRFTPPQVGVTGFEPVTPASQMQCADQTALYSEKYKAHKTHLPNHLANFSILAKNIGFEPMLEWYYHLIAVCAFFFI